QQAASQPPQKTNLATTWLLLLEPTTTPIAPAMYGRAPPLTFTCEKRSNGSTAFRALELSSGNPVCTCVQATQHAEIVALEDMSEEFGVAACRRIWPRCTV